MKTKSLFVLFMLVSQVSISQENAVLYKNSKVENSEKYKTGNIYQKDFLLFMDILRTSHPAFCDDATFPFNINRTEEDGYLKLDKKPNKENLQLLLQMVAAQLNDGHTFISNTLDFSNNAFYPINIRKYSGSYYIRVIDKEYESVLGCAIKTINEIPIDSVINDFGKYISHENHNELEVRAIECLLLPYFWQQIPYCRQDSTILISFEDGQEISISAKYRKDMNLAVIPQQGTEELTKPNNQLFSYQINENSKICYLQFNACMDYNTLVYQIEMTAKNEEQKQKMYEKLETQKGFYPKFDHFLENMFAEISAKNITALVVDVRNNGGGNSALCNQLLSYLLDYKDLKEISSFIRISELFKLKYPEIFKRAIDFNENIVIGNLYNCKDLNIGEDNEDILNKFFPVNNDSSKIFRGKTYFIQGKGTYSSAGDLIILARDNKIGTIIGENSIYRPCNYGDILMWQLPNTNITGGVSHKYFIRPQESLCYEDAINPDIVIESSTDEVKKGIDVVWRWITDNNK
ncbi:MAG: hypothetical protein LBI82_07275 [Dysgonamonadaceae bacterium]|jgi:hypothetical protein|nr:hypothetical protein [Dysgonamonadaceae bacterium]